MYDALWRLHWTVQLILPNFSVHVTLGKGLHVFGVIGYIAADLECILIGQLEVKQVEDLCNAII